ncbi:23S rRNA (uracil(747)-C(5))-methyltransferase RlmC [Rothia aerolata]|uniref:23S rRNA (Uracil(747)-C(5))-methyltransferase RlmC n=1 Tax=Rothia aerolata TaxID=1812262 RepID=A0A917MSV2_9MICC|nr:23S rRNA (uracil(747)-C(5))-methyltransferase RlmC [Rothia aerolata]GGH61568.1 23S rRNA (uracil(747)-C(5))-methyltransferase RlmC [Rothia aerolata]
MQCPYFDANICRSCTQMGVPYTQQVQAKDAEARALLSPFGEIDWLEPVASAEEGFRNKAKIVVAGSVQEPTLGIVNPRTGIGSDLSECGLYEPALSAMMPVFRALIQRAQLTPYNIKTQKGELKNILVTLSPNGASMVRFVLRSKKLLVPIRREIQRLQAEIPGLTVVSVNLLREPIALVEGAEEIILTEAQTLPMQLSELSLHLRPQSFFQTNTAIADALYHQGREWVAQAAPRSLWDLYCGVGGFGLHAATVLDGAAEVTGIEVSSEAIASAQRTAGELKLENMHFEAADATEFALAAAPVDYPELLVVNPPRRGIGEKLADWVQTSGIQTVIYSSCNVRSLAKDLECMPGFRVAKARVLDMFPQTNHYEVITLLERKK